MQPPDHSQRCAVAAGGKRPGIAVGQNRKRFAGIHVGQCIIRHSQIGGQVVLMDLNCRFGEALYRLLQGMTLRKHLFHFLQRPEQVHRRWPGGRQFANGLLDLRFPVTATSVPGCKGNTVRGADSDRWRPTHHHIADTLSHPGGALQRNPVFLVRQQPLIQQFKTSAMPANGYGADSTVTR